VVTRSLTIYNIYYRIVCTGKIKTYKNKLVDNDVDSVDNILDGISLEKPENLVS